MEERVDLRTRIARWFLPEAYMKMEMLRCENIMLRMQLDSVERTQKAQAEHIRETRQSLRLLGKQLNNTDPLFGIGDNMP